MLEVLQKVSHAVPNRIASPQPTCRKSDETFWIWARLNRVFANERVGGFDGLFFLPRLVVRVHQVELQLAAEIAERVTGLNGLVNLDAAAVVATANRRLRRLVLGKRRFERCAVRGGPATRSPSRPRSPVSPIAQDALCPASTAGPKAALVLHLVRGPTLS